MFTGIVEAIGKIVEITENKANKDIWIEVPGIVDELKIDQSIAHNGVCLTVVEIKDNIYKVTAIEETLKKSNLGLLKVGDLVNIERSLKIGDRLDGHWVQGHVDTTAQLIGIENKEGSHVLRFTYNHPEFFVIDKGSVALNGVSLTVVDPTENEFSVAIIPYTWEHTNLSQLKLGDLVNMEFDFIGKYIQKLFSIYSTKS